jgi:hypothetical protein
VIKIFQVSQSGVCQYMEKAGKRYFVALSKTTLIKKNWTGSQIVRLESREEAKITATAMNEYRRLQRVGKFRAQEAARTKVKTEVLAEYRASHTAGERAADGLLNAGHVDREVKRRMKRGS